MATSPSSVSNWFQRNITEDHVIPKNRNFCLFFFWQSRKTQVKWASFIQNQKNKKIQILNIKMKLFIVCFTGITLLGFLFQSSFATAGCRISMLSTVDPGTNITTGCPDGKVLSRNGLNTNLQIEVLTCLETLGWTNGWSSLPNYNCITGGASMTRCTLSSQCAPTCPSCICQNGLCILGG